MAEHEQDNQERTEQPTPRRLERAREEGQVPRSRELAACLVLLAASGALLLMHGPLSRGLRALMSAGLQWSAADIFDAERPVQALGDALWSAILLIAPLLGLLAVAAVAATLALGGWTFSPKALAPKLERLSPAKGLRRVFGVQGLVELLKSLAKFAVVAVVTVALLTTLAGEMLSLGARPLLPALGRAGWLAGLCLLGLSGALLLIAAVDVPFQLWQHRKRLRMTRQEVKDELKDTEGRPEVKQRIRTLQQELARRRMIEEVPGADVVITNPSHYAVALKYDAGRMRAPLVVAKGADLIAAQIRGVAARHGVELFSAPPLARALYHSTRVGQEIPETLYVAVAQVLAYVFQLRRVRAQGGVAPEAPVPEVDEDPRR